MDKQKVEIVLNEWDYTCGDGCCYDWGVDVIVNGEEMEHKNEDTETILRQVLEHLGYEVDIIRKHNGE